MNWSDLSYMIRDSRFWFMLIEGLLFWGLPLLGFVYAAILLWRAARKKGLG